MFARLWQSEPIVLDYRQQIDFLAVFVVEEFHVVVVLHVVRVVTQVIEEPGGPCKYILSIIQNKLYLKNVIFFS